jgi:serine/threonine protein kinase
MRPGASEAEAAPSSRSVPDDARVLISDFGECLPRDAVRFALSSPPRRAALPAPLNEARTHARSGGWPDRQHGHAAVLPAGVAARHTGGERLRPASSRDMTQRRALAQGASVATDLWSLGCVLHALLFSELPYRADTPAELFQQIRSTHLRFPDQPRRPPRQAPARPPTDALSFADRSRARRRAGWWS